MSFYVAIAGEKRGPYPAYRIIEQLRGGDLSPDVLGWEQGMAAWLKLREIPAFSEVVERLENPFPANPTPDLPADAPAPPLLPGSARRAVEAKATAHGGVLDGETAPRRPLSRFGARMFDYFLVSTVALFFCEIPPMPGNLTLNDLIRNGNQVFPEEAILRIAEVQVWALLLWHFIEGLLIHLWGVTPGKAIFGIWVTAADGSRISPRQAIGRSFLAWGLGCGFGLRFLSLLCMTLGLTMLLTQGQTLWDRLLKTRVHQSAITPARILVVFGGFFLLMILLMFLSIFKFAPA